MRLAGSALLLLLCAGAAACDSDTLVDGQARFQILSPTLIRMEFSDDRKFEDGTTFNRVKHAFAHVRFKTRVRNNWREIETDEILLRYLRGSGPFKSDNTELQLLHEDKAPFAPFAAGPRSPLGGWLRALDGKGDPAALHPGLLSRDGFFILDDSKTAVTGADGWIRPRSGHIGFYEDQYLFAYGHQYARALAELSQLTGAPPLLPRWAFGVWYSRYFPYSQADYKELLQQFRSDGVPLDVLVVDTDWKAPLAGAVPSELWNGWSWNQRLFPDPGAFLGWTRDQGLHVALNIHPSMSPNDPQFSAANAAAGGLHKVDDGNYVWDWGNRRQAAAYFALHDPFEKLGVRFWWLDWCCESGISDVPGTKHDSDLVPPDAWIDSLYAQRAIDRGLRGFAFGRIGARCRGHGAIDSITPTGPWPDRRYTIHFTGDTFPTWGMLGFEIGFTVAEGATGFPYVSHDIGSFFGRALAPDLYVRWVQFGVFQPIFRLHSDHGQRLPWEYGAEARGIVEKFMQLRESLVPYIYTLARQAVDTGLPLVRGLYLAYPNQENAYKYANEYFFGDAFLVMPIATPDNQTRGWFPPGTWVNIFTGERVAGPAEQTVSAPLETMPVFARAGAIVPRQPPMGHVGEKPIDPLLVDVYAGADGSFSLYEDEGEGLRYREGSFRRTPMRWEQSRGALTIGPADGRYDGAAAARAYTVALFGVDRPARVSVDGVALPASAWRYDEERKVLHVDVATHDVSHALRLELS